MAVLFTLGACSLAISHSSEEKVLARSASTSALLQANFTYSVNINLAKFVDVSTGDITGWNWTFGDGGSSILKNPYHEYSQTGSYVVTLTVTGTAGYVSVSSAVVRIEHVPGAFAILIPLVVLVFGGAVALAVKNAYFRIAIVVIAVMFLALYLSGFFDMLQVKP